jgi:hypothetical protein
LVRRHFDEARMTLKLLTLSAKSKIRTWLLCGIIAAIGTAVVGHASLVGLSGSRGASSSPGGGGGGGDADLFPSYNTLTLMVPRDVGAAGIGPTDGLEATNRVFYAYPALEYDIPVTWWGGSYPIVRCTLSNAPAGMVCEQYTMRSGALGWRVRWPSPDTTATNIGIEIEDKLGATDSSEWDITVGTSGWFFADSVNDGAGDTGTISAPFDSLEQARLNTTISSRLYLRAGTYPVTTTDNAGAVFARQLWETNARSSVFLAYPGETVTIDHGGGAWAPMIYFGETGTESSVWFQGMRFYNGDNFAVYLDQAHNYGSMFYDVEFDTFGPAVGVDNQAMITTQHVSTCCTVGFAAVSSEFHNLDSHCAIKFYDTQYAHVVGNYFHDTVSNNDTGLVALKGLSPDFYGVANLFEDIGAAAFGGNFATDASLILVGGEFGYNDIRDGASLDTGLTNTGILIRELGDRDPIWIYRNTIQGQIAGEDYDSGDANVVVHRNLMITPDCEQTPVPGIFDYGVWTAPEKWTLTENLCNASASGILDANALTTGATRTSNGPGSGDDVGHELP